MLASLLQWQTIIFLVPFGVASLLLALTAMRPRHGSGHIAHAASHHAAGGGAHRAAAGAAHHTSHGHHAGTSTRTQGARGKTDNAPTPPSLAHILGFDEVPAIVLVESFFVAWGVGGLLANQSQPGSQGGVPHSIVLSITCAAAAGTVGTLVAGQMLSRLLPRDENLAVEKNNLFGATGEVAYTVTKTGGRILVYDQYGTLHDEMCTLAEGHQPIQKGQRARISDIDSNGKFVVEPDTIDLAKPL